MSSNLQMKILAKETAIYGVSSIVGKFLNWLLVPLYTYVLQQQSDYGIVTNLYAWTALLLVILTYVWRRASSALPIKQKKIQRRFIALRSLRSLPPLCSSQ